MKLIASPNRECKELTVRAPCVVTFTAGYHIIIWLSLCFRCYSCSIRIRAANSNENVFETVSRETSSYEIGPAPAFFFKCSFQAALSGTVYVTQGRFGTWHKVDAKHLPAYLDKMCFRFNNRKSQYLFRDTIIKLIASPNLEYKELTAQIADPAA
jgi:hypothetical protein